MRSTNSYFFPTFAAGLIALTIILLTQFNGEALAQGLECKEGMSEVILVLPNGSEQLMCLPEQTVDAIANTPGATAIEVNLDKKVFVTSGRFSGDLITEADTLTGTLASTGLQAGDLICQHLADNAGIGGTFKAWLSDSTGVSPSNRFAKATVPYVKLNGFGSLKVADDYADLINCGNPRCLQAHINVDENAGQGGIPDLAQLVWTGTDSNGQSVPPDFPADTHCNNWTNAGIGIRAPVGVISTGQSLDHVWTNVDSGQAACNGSRHLYCFEQ